MDARDLGWTPGILIKVSRDGTAPSASTHVGMLADNIKWSPDGHLLVTGQLDDARAFLDKVEDAIVNVPFTVLKIDPDTLTAEAIVSLEHEHFGAATTALIVGDELWVGSCRNDRIAYFTDDGAAV